MLKRGKSRITPGHLDQNVDDFYSKGRTVLMVEMEGDTLLSTQYKAFYLPMELVNRPSDVLLPTCNLFSTKNSPPWPLRPYLPYFVTYSSFPYAKHLRHTGLLFPNDACHRVFTLANSFD